LKNQLQVIDTNIASNHYTSCYKRFPSFRKDRSLLRQKFGH